MSSIGTNSEDLVLNADGGSSEIKLKIDGTEKASISSAGAFTSTTIDATKLSGALPAISGASLTALPAAQLTGTLPAISGANLTSLPATTSITTTNSSDTVFDHALKVNNSRGSNDSFVSLGFHSRADVNTTGLKGALVFDGTGQSDGIGDFVFCNSTAANIATAVTPSDETLRITSAGKVGIGTASPTSILNVHNSTGSDADGARETKITFSGTKASGAVKNTGTIKAVHHGTGNDSNGRLEFEGGQGGTQLSILSTGGITFNGDTASANALDDYEDGTWTPTVATGTVSPSAAYYTKIGRIVHFSATLSSFSDTSTAAGVSISGLPFTILAPMAMGTAFGRYINQNGGWSTTYGGGTTFYIYEFADNNWRNLSHDLLDSSSTVIYVCGTYTV